MKWIYLVIAIVGELIATSALKESEGFTQWLPSMVTLIGYGVTFYFLALALQQIPMGVAYAIWAGLGIILVCLVGYFRFQQTLDLPALLGIGLIVLGVAFMNLFSKTMGG
ncbi:MAG: multidrug efflux SMR transporter [Bacteroidota bacterium]